MEWSGTPAETRIESELNHLWDGTIFGPLNSNSGVSARWFGKLYVPTTDNYTFRTRFDDRGKLYIDGELVLDSNSTA
jgi:hypothetical protein